MNLSVDMLLKFPGILITIGLVLFVLSIILIVLAYFSVDTPVKEENYDLESTNAIGNDFESKPKLDKNNLNLDGVNDQSLEVKPLDSKSLDSDDGLDLTKVFEIVPNADKILDTSSADTKEVNTDEFVSDSKIDPAVDAQVYTQEEDEEIELL